MAYPPHNSRVNWIFDPAPPPSRDHGDLTSPAPSRDHGIQTNGKENMPPQNTPPASFRESYGREEEKKSSLGQQPIIIRLPGRLERRSNLGQQPIIIRLPERLEGRSSLGQRPIIIRLPERLEISLGQVGQPGQRCVPR